MSDEMPEISDEAAISWTEQFEDGTESRISLTAVEAVELAPDHGTIVQFIKELDSEMEDWDSTLLLCEHFAALKRQYDEEVAQEAATAAEVDLGGEG